MASWGLRFLLNCRPAAYRRSTEASIRLLAYSQRKLRETVSETDVAYDGLRNGILKIVADPKALDADEAEARSLSRLGLVYERMRSEEHTSELQSLMRISYAVFCLKKKTHIITVNH